MATLPPILHAANRSPARLKVSHAKRSGSKLTVSGTISSLARNTIRIDFAKTSKARAVLRTHATPHSGRWTVTIRLPKSLRSHRLYLTVSFPGAANLSDATVRRTVT